MEFYAAGNIILTDADYKIISLLRLVTISASDAPAPSEDTHKDSKTFKQGSTEKIQSGDQDNIRIAVGEIYDVSGSRAFVPMSSERLLGILQLDISATLPSSKTKKADKKNEGDVDSLKRVLRQKLGADYGPVLVDHALLGSKLDPSIKVGDLQDPEKEEFKSLLNAFAETDAIVESCQTKPQKGWIWARSHSRKSSNTESQDSLNAEKDFLEYDDLQPFPFASSKKDLISIEFDSFNKAADTYFSSLESQKLEMKARQAQANADRKLQSVRSGHAAQVAGLSALQEQSEANACAIEHNLDQVESLLSTIRGFVASGMDWIDLGELIKEEARHGNQLAKLVVGLKLEISMVTIKLPDPFEEEEQSDPDSSDSSLSDSEDDNQTKKVVKNKKTPIQDKSLKIDLDIYSSAYANARRYYDSRKVAVVKQEKTIAAADKILKTTEKKIQAELKAATQAVPAGIVKMRKAYWFEKFLWFISSENYLVIGGRDAGQNEVFYF